MEMHPKFLERMGIYDATIAGERTDRCLCAPFFTYLPILLYNDTTIADTMKDWRNAIPSYIKYHEEFQPDFCYGPEAIFPGSALDALGCNFVRWPGKHFPEAKIGFQVVDTEEGFMHEDEYLEFAEDPTGFYLTKILPRHWSRLEGFAGIDLVQPIWHGALYSTLGCLDPKMQDAFAAMTECGKIMAEQVAADGQFYVDMISKGFPCGVDFVTSAPFDVFNDTLRGFMNVSMDMYECPDELELAVNAVTKRQIRMLKATIASRPIKTIGFMLHNGFDSFMSKEQFERFYWPGLKASINTCIENNVIPWIYVEDSYMSKLDILERDVPANKVLFTFTGGNDMKAIKERWGNRYAFKGGLTETVLEYGTPEDVVKMTKNAIDIYAPGGGYILDTDVAMDYAKPENLRALFETANNYMKY